MEHVFRITITHEKGETMVITDYEKDAFAVLEAFLPNMDYQKILIEIPEKNVQEGSP